MLEVRIIKNDRKLIEFGEFIFKRRMMLRLTLKQASELVGVSSQYISYLERGRKNPSDDVLFSMERAYDLKKGHLFKMLGRMTLDAQTKIVNNPSLHKIVSDIIENDSLSLDEKDELYKEIEDLYNKYLK